MEEENVMTNAPMVIAIVFLLIAIASYGFANMVSD
jgi:hypothetical protein